MRNDLRRIRIFVASPSDVATEREMLTSIVEDLNLTFGNDRGVFFELIKWESHTFPDVGDDAQDVINQQITDYDIFVGIMWERFGTPTKRSASGTKEEFERALKLYLEFSRPIIMFYFKTAPARHDTIEQVEQMRQVIEFKNQLRDQGVYYREYEGEDQFTRVARNHLTMHAIKMLQYQEATESVTSGSEARIGSEVSSQIQDTTSLEAEVRRLSALMEEVLDKQRLSDRHSVSSVQVVSPSRYDALKMISKQLARERTSLRLLGISLGDFLLDRGVLHSLLLETLYSRKELQVQALVLDPRSEALRLRARFEAGEEYFNEPAFFDSTTFIETDGALRVGKKLCQKFRTLEIRSYDIPPLCFLIMTSNRAFVEHYTYGGRGGNSIILSVSSDDDLYEKYERHFARIWEQSTAP